MSTLTYEIVIDAPTETVWAVLAELPSVADRKSVV